MSADFEGGELMPRQMGMAEIDSNSVRNLAFEDWTEATTVRSIFCVEEKSYRNPFCLPDTGPQFCAHEWVDTYKEYSNAILYVVQSRAFILNG
jgi:hypothetical protein